MDKMPLKQHLMNHSAPSDTRDDTPGRMNLQAFPLPHAVPADFKLGHYPGKLSVQFASRRRDVFEEVPRWSSPVRKFGR
jgi:hypothetical protein